MCGIIWLEHQDTKLFFLFAASCASIKVAICTIHSYISELPPFPPTLHPSKAISDEGKMRADALGGIGAQERFYSKIF